MGRISTCDLFNKGIYALIFFYFHAVNGWAIHLRLCHIGLLHCSIFFKTIYSYNLHT